MSAILQAGPRHAGLEDAPLRADGLVKRYDGRSVLAGVSLQVEPGSVLGLIGRNGAGKSTLIRALLGLIEVDGGHAEVWGRPALRMGDGAKARLAYVPQQPDALSWLQVGQMLDLVGRFYPRWDAGYVRTTLERWGLSPNQVLGKLSPGERQRVALVRALAARPWIRSRAATCCARSRCARAKPAPRCCSPPPSSPTWNAWPRTSPSCTTDGCCWTASWMR